jgi:hypothetical protein
MDTPCCPPKVRIATDGLRSIGFESRGPTCVRPLPPVSRLPRYYAALRLPELLPSPLWFPLSATYLDANAFLITLRRAFADAERLGVIVNPGLRRPGMNQGESGPPRFLGRPLRACRGRSPRRWRRRLALIGDAAAAFRAVDPLGHQNYKFSRLLSPGPPARVPSHRRPRYRDRRQARYRPAGLRL